MAFNYSTSGTSVTWNNWATDSSNTSISTTDTWSTWTNDTAGTSTGCNVWYLWVDNGATDNNNWQPVSPQRSTEEAEKLRQQEVERETKRREAQQKAEELLVQNLSEEQRKAYREKKVIPIRSRSGRDYEIHKGRMGNVRRINNGKAVESYCIHPSEYVPDEDTMLTQLLWLRWCEEDFLRVANVTRIAA